MSTTDHSRAPEETALPRCPDAERCCCSKKVEEALLRYFKFPSCQVGQMEATVALLHGKDVFVRMATGSGKSLCMFLAPISKNDSAMGVVLSPLISLMEQQVI